MNQPALIPGRNSCRKITNKDGELVRYLVKGFSYPVPAFGARSRSFLRRGRVLVKVDNNMSAEVCL